MAKDFLRPVSPSIFESPIGQEIASIASAIPEGLAEAIQASSEGLIKTAKIISDGLQIPRTVPSQEFIGKLRHPVVAMSTLFVLVNSSSGKTLNERLQTVKHMLALMKSESNMNPSMRASIPTTYEGRKVISIVKGALSFTNATYGAALKRGASIISNDRILRPGFDAALFAAKMAGWRYSYGSKDIGLDPNQIIANIGQMANLNDVLRKEWVWDAEEGWRPKSPLSSSTAGGKFMTVVGDKLLSLDLGKQAILSFYHINGLYALKSKNLYHSDRYKQDCDVYKNIAGIPQFRDFIISNFPEASIYINSGVGDIEVPQVIATSDLGKKVINEAASAMIAAGNTPSATAETLKDMVDDDIYNKIKAEQDKAAFLEKPYAYNRFIKEVYKFKYDYKPQGNAFMTAGFDDPRSYGKHGAIDYAAEIGQPVFAMDSGPCITLSQPPGKGYGLYIQQEGIVTKSIIRYGHLSKSLVKPNEIVKKGDIIAFSGNTGHSTGPHLHLEMRNPVTKEKLRWPTKISNPRDSVNKIGV